MSCFVLVHSTLYTYMAVQDCDQFCCRRTTFASFTVTSSLYDCWILIQSWNSLVLKKTNTKTLKWMLQRFQKHYYSLPVLYYSLPVQIKQGLKPKYILLRILFHTYYVQWYAKRMWSGIKDNYIGVQCSIMHYIKNLFSPWGKDEIRMR